MLPPLKKVISRKSSVVSLFIFLFLTYNLQLTTYNYSFAQSSKLIRVAIIQDAESVSLKVSGHYEICGVNTGRALKRGKNLRTTISASRDEILVGQEALPTDKIMFKLAIAGTALLDGRRFKGDLQFIRRPNRRLSVINYINLEDYTKGILYHEASHYWPIEALVAQAIACRTYAIYQAQENKIKDYDVTSDIYSQVYGGSTSERYRTNQAVEQTKGSILVYQGRPFPAYYHATCAGYTEDASALWNIDLPVLKGLACNFCRGSPHFNWHSVLASDELIEALGRAGYPLKDLKDIAIVDKDASGRIANMKITSAAKAIRIPAKDFRNILGPNRIRSTNFNVEVVNHDIVFTGFGWGHGVGLCQWGGYFMAKEGYSAEQILKYYYPGATLSLLSPYSLVLTP